MAQTAGNLRLTGNGSAIGGKYDTIRIVGDTEIDGSVECEEFRCIGECEVEGSIKAEQMKVTGTLMAAQHMFVEHAKFRGEAEIRGNVGAGRFDMLGNLTVRGDCEAESLDVKGTFAIDGLLNADTIHVRLYGSSRAKEIGGEKIEIRRRSKLSRYMMPFLFAGSDSLLSVDTIEGDDIYLEYTQAACVRGKDVTIGPGCIIGTVEYTRHFLADPDSHISGTQKV